VNGNQKSQVCSTDLGLGGGAGITPQVLVGEFNDGSGSSSRFFTGEMWNLELHKGPLVQSQIERMLSDDPATAKEQIEVPDRSACEAKLPVPPRLYNGTIDDPMASCKQMLGSKPSGMYYIKPEGQANPQLTYCEMDENINGGGWTQVAFAASNERVFWGTVSTGMPDKKGFSINAQGMKFDTVLITHEGIDELAEKYKQFNLNKTQSFVASEQNKVFSLSNGRYMVLGSKKTCTLLLQL
jgi:hypothetical protein